MRATVPFLAAGMAALAASCGSPSSGDSGDGTPVTSNGGNNAGTDSGASGTDGGFSFAGGSSSGGSTGAGGSQNASGSSGKGGTSGGAGGNAGSTGTGGDSPVGACSTFTKDCDGDKSNGCETDVSSDPNNCGVCSKVCAGAAHAAGTCFVGKCDIACDSGWADCNTTASDGCEQDLTSDPNNCGACGMVCQNTTCVNRACQCGSTTTVPPKIPLDMYILFDQSGSMNENVTGGTKWDVIKGALTTFVNSPGSVGMRVGIGYFPLTTTSGTSGTGGGGGFCIPFLTCGGGGGGTESCNWLDYATPDVGIDVIPTVSPTFINSLNNHGPGGNTPTYPALQGAYDYAKIWATANPNRKTIVVLATDGNPTKCGSNNNPTDISNQLVAPALAGNPSLLTFVIGVGSSLTSLNQIAAAGGTGQAFIIDTAGADPGGQFLAAMQAIQGSAALGCEYGVPTAPSGGAADLSKVNVQFTPLNGSPTLLKKVTDEQSCDAQTGGWHYDNNNTPTKIQLCNSSCTAIQSFVGARVEVLLGCASVG